MRTAEKGFAFIDRAFKVIAWNVSAAVASKAAETTQGFPVQVGSWTIFLMAQAGAGAFAAPYMWSVADEIYGGVKSPVTRWIALFCFWLGFAAIWGVIYIGVRTALAGVRF